MMRCGTLLGGRRRLLQRRIYDLPASDRARDVAIHLKDNSDKDGDLSACIRVIRG
jgi:hypothetical protein